MQPIRILKTDRVWTVSSILEELKLKPPTTQIKAALDHWEQHKRSPDEWPRQLGWSTFVLTQALSLASQGESVFIFAGPFHSRYHVARMSETANMLGILYKPEDHTVEDRASSTAIKFVVRLTDLRGCDGKFLVDLGCAAHDLRDFV